MVHGMVIPPVCLHKLFPVSRLQNSPYFCTFKYARTVKQKVWSEAENRERDWGETPCFTDFEKKPTVLQSTLLAEASFPWGLN